MRNLPGPILAPLVAPSQAPDNSGPPTVDWGHAHAIPFRPAHRRRQAEHIASSSAFGVLHIHGEVVAVPISRERLFERRRASVAAARAFVVEVLLAAGIEDRVEDVRLCTSELATNALRHGSPPGRNVLVRAEVDEMRLRIEVHDAGAGRPGVRAPDDEAADGRGLFLVAHLSDDWGVSSRTGVGKAVWAEFKLVPSTPPPY